jgi:pimeloyl-ACP methyl ester carboxylesterase
LNNDIPHIEFGGRGPVLHFAHPNAYPPECFRQFLASFTERYRVVGMVQRPLWPNQQPEAVTDWRVLADDLIGFFDQEGWRDVIGVGHSLGAAVTMLAAVKRPELFRQLVLIDPVFLSPSILEAAAQLPDKGTNSPYVLAARNRRNRWPDKAAAFAHYRQKPVFGRFTDEALWDYVNYNIVPDGTDTVTLRYTREWEAHLYTLLIQQGEAVWAALPKVAHPTLAIRASQTDTLFEEAWLWWQQLQPTATFIEVPEVSHMLVLERPSLVAQIVLAYLKVNSQQ